MHFEMQNIFRCLDIFIFLVLHIESMIFYTYDSIRDILVTVSILRDQKTYSFVSQQLSNQVANLTCSFLCHYIIYEKKIVICDQCISRVLSLCVSVLIEQL